ncbi:MAG: hypothetical protein ACFB14_25200 [Leptolyngbyaceae cyanobacterium]
MPYHPFYPPFLDDLNAMDCCTTDNANGRWRGYSDTSDWRNPAIRMGNL